MKSGTPDCLKIAGDIRARRRSAQEIVRDSLDAAERLQEKFRAFIKLTRELARK